MRRDLILSASLVVLLVAMLPAYGRVFADDDWRAPVLLAGLVALALATVLRRLGVAAIVSAAASVVALTGFVYVTALPDVGWLPDTSSWRAFLDLMEAAATDLRNEPAPVASSLPFTVGLGIGVWVVFHAAHEVVVRFRMPGAGVTLPLVLWALPLAVPLDGGGELARALPFLAAAGLVLLLGTDEGQGSDEPARATASGLAVGVGALVLVVAAPLLLPGYGAAALVDLAGGDSPRGYQPIVDISERLQLPAERDVLRVQASERTYLRLAGLDSFDGATWRLGPAGVGSYQPDEDALYPATRDLPPEEDAFATTPVQVQVEVLDLANIYVPAPYQPVRVLGPFRDEMVWSTEGGFLATWNLGDGDGSARVGVTEGVEYRIEADRPTPDIDVLRGVTYDEATLERWTQLPDGYAELGDAARDVFEAADATTPVDQALALQDWFTDGGGFTYDLDVPALRGEDALRDFVLRDRVGYCEYFATAMAVMLREAGIPARVAVGFLPGDVTLAADPEAGRDLTEYTVSTDDAHAWVEVLFPGFGWVTFEPTPRSDLTQIVPTEDDLAPTENLRERNARLALEEAAERDDDPSQTPEPTTPPEDPVPVPSDETTVDASGGARGDDDGASRWPWLVATALVGLAAVALAGRRRRPTTTTGTPAEQVVAAQRYLLSSARRYGVGRRDHESTHEVARRWRQEHRVGDEALRFAAVAESASFGGDVDDDIAREATALVREVEAQLRASVPTRNRVMAPVRVPFDTVAAGARRARGRVDERRRGNPD